MPIQDTDAFLVARNGTNYQTPASNIMAIQDTDLLVVSRGGTNYKVTGLEVKEDLSVLSLNAFKSAPLPFTTIQVAWGENEIVVWGTAADTLQYLFRSTDGINWTQGPQVSATTYGSTSVLSYGGNNTYMFWPFNLGVSGFVSRDGGLNWQNITFPEAPAGNRRLWFFLGCPGAPGDPAARFLITPRESGNSVGLTQTGYYTLDGAATAWKTTAVPLSTLSSGQTTEVRALNACTLEGFTNIPNWLLNIQTQQGGGSVSNGSIYGFNTSTEKWVAIGGLSSGSGIDTNAIGKSWPIWMFYAGSPAALRTFYWQGNTTNWVEFNASPLLNRSYKGSGGPGWTGPNGEAIFSPTSQGTGIYQMDNSSNTLSGDVYVQGNMPDGPGASNYFKGKFFWFFGTEVWYANVSTRGF